MERASVLTINDLTVRIPGRTLLDGVGMDVPSGRSVAVMGASGSGKSTLLSCVLGLIKPVTGTVLVAGRDVTRMKHRELMRHRRSTIGMVFQNGELIPELTALENVAVAALLAGTQPREAQSRAAELLETLEVPSAPIPAGLLSGGERQRTALARALVNSPALIIADEPTGALDERTRDGVADLLFDLPSNGSCGLLVVTHDESIASRADVRLRLEDGVLASTQAVR